MVWRRQWHRLKTATHKCAAIAIVVVAEYRGVVCLVYAVAYAWHRYTQVHTFVYVSETRDADDDDDFSHTILVVHGLGACIIVDALSTHLYTRTHAS